MALLARNIFDATTVVATDLPSKMLAAKMPELRSSSDYAGLAMYVVNTVAFTLLRFVSYRMDVTRGHDPTSGYLFADTEKTARFGKRADDARDQFELALQLDCMHFLVPVLGAAAKIEPSDIASGRADIAVETSGIRFSIEVKHEDSDASHPALFRKYGGQGTEYSNTNIRIGFLLVLDRSRTDGSGGHLTDKFSVQQVLKEGEAEPRLLIVVSVPGKRKRPSAIGPVAEPAAPADVP